MICYHNAHNSCFLCSGVDFSIEELHFGGSYVDRRPVARPFRPSFPWLNFQINCLTIGMKWCCELKFIYIHEEIRLEVPIEFSNSHALFQLEKWGRGLLAPRSSPRTA
jgi:hypothetical protein